MLKEKAVDAMVRFHIFKFHVHVQNDDFLHKAESHSQFKNLFIFD